VRKIISILLALGLVLAFSAVAMPTSAATCTATVTAVVPPFCASGVDTYNISIAASPVTLLAGNDLLSVDFGAGTSLAGVTAAGVTVGGVAVSSVVISGTHIEFPVPAQINYGVPINIVIVGVVNPATPGDYTLNLDYKLSCCAAIVFGCATYTVVPAKTTYDFFWDSSPTYPGLAAGFVPPFKACGQETFPGQNISGKWANLFNLILKPTLVGCAGPCGTTNVTITLNLTAAPAGSNVTLNFSGTVYNLVPTTAIPQPQITVGNVSLGANDTITWNNAIHFDTVSAPGVYTICLKAICPAGNPDCTTGCNPAAVTVADECFNIKVYQWKDAAKITLKEKWNLISLPLVPLADPPVASVLAAIPAADRANILSIWHYNRCTDKWAVWPTPAAGQETLAQLIDGESYWVRVKYPLTGCGNITLWVWGTAKPMPPAAPAQYNVCAGWNMVGFLGTSNSTPNAYFWNWTVKPVVYTWDPGCWNVQNWRLLAGADALTPGAGYWAAFPAAGAIYVP
jgi:hypothetical protein